jgi:hypothetical protein
MASTETKEKTEDFLGNSPNVAFHNTKRLEFRDGFFSASAKTSG